MTAVSSTLYQTCQTFSVGDAGGGTRFKIDRYGNWQESYPTADHAVTQGKTYRISFYSDTHIISVAEVTSCSGFSSVFPSLYFRGTANAWGSTAMQLVANNTWETTVTFDGQSNQRYKVDVKGDWSQNYGDNNSDGTLDLSGSDIYTNVVGSYKLSVNDATKRYTLTAIGGCTSNCGGGSTVTTLGAVYSNVGTTFSLWSPDKTGVQLWLDGQLYAMSKVTNFNGYTDVYQVSIAGNGRAVSGSITVEGTAVTVLYH